MKKLEEKYLKKLKILNETIWEGKVSRKKINKWLENFEADEKIHALYLLTEFIYFNAFQIETLLISIYRDLYQSKQIREIRINNHNTLDSILIKQELKNRLLKTRFVTLGGASESSTMLMYKFSHVNKIPKSLCINEDKILSTKDSISHFIFIDDFSGSGSQAIEYSEKVLKNIHEKYPDSTTSYYLLVATKESKAKIFDETMFDDVDSILELDSSYKCFNENSRIFQNKDKYIDVDKINKFSGDYGEILMKSILQRTFPDDEDWEITEESRDSKLGFNDGQLLLGFSHNTPDNTLPIIWYNEDMENWNPIFKRYNKVYSI